MPSVDKILGDLSFGRYNNTYLDAACKKATMLAICELQRFRDESDSGLKQPRHYPVAMLLRATALARSGHYRRAQAIIANEASRYSTRSRKVGLSEHTNFFLLHYIGLAAVIAKETNGTKGADLIGTLAGKVAADMGSELGDNLVTSATNLRFGDLLQTLNERSYLLRRPVSAAEYEMP